MKIDCDYEQALSELNREYPGVSEYVLSEIRETKNRRLLQRSQRWHKIAAVAVPVIILVVLALTFVAMLGAL